MDGYAPTHEKLLMFTQARCPDLTPEQQEEVATLAATFYPKFKEPLFMVKLARHQFNKTLV